MTDPASNSNSGSSPKTGESSAKKSSSSSSTSGGWLRSLGMLSGSNVTHRLADIGRSFVASLASAPVDSSFIEKGTLTPQEFVDAGDQLAYKFPTWQWEGGMDGQRRCSWLPAEKQYLITRSVPSYRRVKDMDASLVNKEVDGGWLMPLLMESDEQQEEEQLKKEEMKREDETALHAGSNGAGLNVAAVNSSKQSEAQEAEEGEAAAASVFTIDCQLHNAAKKDDDGVPDLLSFAEVDDLLQEEEDPAAAKSANYFVKFAPDAEIVAARTYDISITYDKYFQTPRIWLFGYNENGIPLTPEEIFEDILTDYAAKTVTVDPHPCTGIPTATIHPCRHASVMKKVVDNWIEREMKPRHDLALLVLLKFISSVMPTIEYDFTMDVDMFINTVSDKRVSRS